MKIPTLRFPEFKGDWELKKLGEVTSYVDYRGRAPIKTEEGCFLVTAKNIKKGFIDYECSKEYVAENDYSNVMSKGLPAIGDVLFTTEAPMGNVAQIDKVNVALAQRVIKFRGKVMLSNFFLLHYMLSDIFQKNISQKSIGTTVQGISGKELHKIKLSFPTLSEQQKIANFLTAVDEKLQTLKQKKNLLEQYKKGVMQQIFSQEIRFKDDKENTFADWEEKKVKDIFVVTRGNVLSMTLVSDKQDDNNFYPVYSSQTKNNGLSGYYYKYLFEDCITWTTDGAGAGDVNFRKGKFYCTNVCGVLKNNKGYANVFIAEMLNSISRKYVSYVGNPKLMNNVMAEISISIPTSIVEQTKIAHFLSAIDDKINHCQAQITHTEVWKKGLLQQMFC